PLGGGRPGGSPAGAPGEHPDGAARLAGHLLEPWSRRWRPDPVADAPLPRSPRRPGPDALWGDRRGSTGGGPESGARAPAAPGIHAPRAAHPGLLGPAADPRPGLRGPWHCADL